MGYLAYYRLGLFNPPTRLTHLPRLTRPTLKLLDLRLVTVGGRFRPLETDSGGSVGGLLLQNLTPTNLTNLHQQKATVCSRLKHYSIKSRQIRTRSRQDLEDFGQIRLDFGQIWRVLSKSPPPLPNRDRLPLRPKSFTSQRWVWKLHTRFDKISSALGTNQTRTDLWTLLPGPKF